MKKGYTNDFFRQFEELNYKLDSLLEENKKIKSQQKKEINKISKDFKIEISSLNDTIKNLNKAKKSGGFRTMKGANSYVNALSIIKTSIKRDINPYDSIKAIFNNEVLFQY